MLKYGKSALSSRNTDTVSTEKGWLESEAVDGTGGCESAVDLIRTASNFPLKSVSFRFGGCEKEDQMRLRRQRLRIGLMVEVGRERLGTEEEGVEEELNKGARGGAGMRVVKLDVGCVRSSFFNNPDRWRDSSKQY